MAGIAAIRDCLGPLAAPSRPRRALPAGSWDTHFHVLGPESRHPYAATRKYTPPDAPLEACLALHAALGIARGLVVHANTHGFDNAIDLEAVAGSRGRYLAVVRLDAGATRAGCEKLHAQGARGVRFAFNPQHGGSLDHAMFDHVLDCIASLGWFVELHFYGGALPGLAPWLAAIPATVVIDHKKMIETAPDRCLWGSDWPHTGLFEPARMPDDGTLLDALFDFAPDEAVRKRILVDNPCRLLGLAETDA